jgi:beta-lactam-binding protein with PASTA domain
VERGLMKKLLPAVVAAAVLVAAGATATSAVSAAEPAAAKVVVPNVVGMRMDRATRTLQGRGLRVNEECSGLMGCWVKSRWWVCEQSPRAGARLARYRVVVIYGERRGEC